MSATPVAGVTVPIHHSPLPGAFGKLDDEMRKRIRAKNANVQKETSLHESRVSDERA
jgi:hypothetical protein